MNRSDKQEVFVALPTGWVNKYDDGGELRSTKACPGVIVVTYLEDDVIKTSYHFAEANGSGVRKASDTSNYLETVFEA